MKVDELADGTLVVTYDGSPLAKFMLGFMVVFVGTAVYDIFIGTRGTDRLIGLLGASATCLVIAIVFFETAWFEFSRPTHLVTWRRRWGFRQRSGTMPFGSIQSVMVERPLGDDGDGAILKVADRIRAVLGHNAEETRSADVSTLVAAGKMIEAIKVLRETEGLNLTDAKHRVDELRQKASSR